MKYNLINVSSLAHRYLSKPCDQQELGATILSSVELEEKFTHKIIKEIAGAVDLLPVSNSQYQTLLELTQFNVLGAVHIANHPADDSLLSAQLIAPNAEHGGLSTHSKNAA